MTLNISKCQFYAVSQMFTPERVWAAKMCNQKDFSVRKFESFIAPILQFYNYSSSQQSPNLHNLYNRQQLKYVTAPFSWIYASSWTDYTHTHRIGYKYCMHSPDKCRASVSQILKPPLIRLMGGGGRGCIHNNGGKGIGRLWDRETGR